MDSAVTYGRYLRIEELLSLQQPRDEMEHDEMLFIIIHQVYELWFKELMHELDYCCRLMGEGDGYRAQHTLKRILTIMKVLVAQLDILETMTPTEFLTFRERLDTASGFQSAQFRVMEFMLGRKKRSHVDRFEEGTWERRELEARWAAPTLWDAFLHYMAREGYPVPADQLDRDVTQPIGATEGVQKALVEVYRNSPRDSELCERLVDLDEGVQEWRYRHVKMVERTIGAKMGTGGSAGSQYLHSTLSPPAFPDLWDIRTQL